MRTVAQMLAALEPQLLPDTFVFACLPEEADADCVAMAPIATFREAEGFTVVVEHSRAEAAGLAVNGLFRCITLGLNSGLYEVGLTAAVATALAKENISANVIAAFHHDHVFVPTERAEEALAVLQGLGDAL